MERVKSTFSGKAILIPIISVFFGFLLGAIVMLIFGYNPIAGYQSMLSSALSRPIFLGETLNNATPLIFTALGFAVANSAGFFNIGLSGQALLGWMISVWTAFVFSELPAILLIPLCVFAGALAGAIGAAIPGALRAFFGTSEVITTIMLNYIYLYLSQAFLRGAFADEWMSTIDSTVIVPSHASFRLEFLTELTQNSRLNLAFFLALIFLVIIWFVMKKTTTGFEIRAVGMNPNAAEYAGISSKRTIILSMSISGALAGLGGVALGLGTFQNYFSQTSSLDIGFNGLAVSLLGNGSAIGILLASLLFAILQNGAAGMQALTIPAEISQIVAASIIFFVGANYLIRLLLDKLTKEHTKVALEAAQVNQAIAPESNEEGGEDK